MYLKLNGEKIHENNNEIQNLAKSLDRSVRSTEAQLLMFRNLEREGNYSHGNMNKISKEIWEQHIDSTENNETTYPQDLLKWAGHRSGGVKKPFRRSSGRPAGKRFQTPLSNRLLGWAKDYVNGEDVPSSILLVGGARTEKLTQLKA